MLAPTLGVWCGKIGPRFSAQTQEGLCWTEAGIMRSACLYGSSLGLRWAQVVPMLGQVGPMLRHRGFILGLCWAKSGPCWAIGPILGLCWAKLGPCWAMLGPLGPRWAYVGPMLAYVGPMLAHIEPSWELCWGHVWAIYVETILRCIFFRRGPPPGAQNHVNRCFLTSPRWNPLPPKGPKHRKKNEFSTPQAKYTVNYSDFSGSGVVWVWTRGGLAAPITFGYYRRPPARTRACGRRPDSEVFFGDATHYINSQGIPKVWRVMVHSPVCLRHLNAP